jgi:predicted component of type VI protein secretion system
MNQAVASSARASLRLCQGSSARASWVLDEVPGGTMISVGTDAQCDWQVRAAFVPARAFSLLLAGGHVFLRSGSEPGVLLNGKAVDEGWNPVPNGARIDVGLARIEVTLEGQAKHEDAPAILEVVEAEETGPRVTRPYISPEARRTQSTTETRAPRSSMPPRDVTRQLEDFRRDESGEYDVVPALLDDEARGDKRSLKRYALLGVITVSAYGGWVALLDYL